MSHKRQKIVEYAAEYKMKCEENDAPRLAAETFPEGVTVDCADDKEIYTPEGFADNKEAFVLIHGGGFVYGSARVDRRFGMHLAKASGRRVFSLEYTLMPSVGIKDQLRELLDGIVRLKDEYGIEKIHLTGDSAGGYLSFAVSMLIRNREMRNILRFTETDLPEAVSVSPICGVFTLADHEFPGELFTMSEDEIIPDFLYDLKEAAGRFDVPKTYISTGDMDFLKQDNRDLYETLIAKGDDARFYEAVSNDSREMKHVYAIFDPTWDESVEVIKGIIENADR